MLDISCKSIVTNRLLNWSALIWIDRRKIRVRVTSIFCERNIDPCCLSLTVANVCLAWHLCKKDKYNKRSNLRKSDSWRKVCYYTSKLSIDVTSLTSWTNLVRLQRVNFRTQTSREAVITTLCNLLEHIGISFSSFSIHKLINWISI